MTTQAAPPTDLQQSPGVGGPQGQSYHHHHDQGKGEDNNRGYGSFIDQLAHSIISDLQQDGSTGALSSPGFPSDPNANGGSSIEGFASVIANDLLTKYQPATGVGPASSLTSPTNQVNAIA